MMSHDARPLLVEIDPQTRNTFLDRVEPWLVTTATLQGTFRKLLEDSIGDIEEPHIRAEFERMLRDAREHEERIGDIAHAFGRDPSAAPLKSVASTLLSKTREVAGGLEGLAGGARGSGWRNVRELLLTNLDTIGGFGVTQQLGLTLGIPEVVKIVFPIIDRKTRHQLYFQETMLEMAPKAILYRQDF